MNIPTLAVVGCGAVAQRYYAPVLKKYPEIVHRLILVDRDMGAAEAFRKGAGGGRIGSDHRDILGEADGALILVPHHLHHPVSMDFLNAGVPVLCEKPLALTPGDAGEMITAAEAAQAALCMNNTRRMFPSLREVRRMIAAGELGRIRKITYCEGSPFGWPSATGFYVNPALTDRGVLLDLGAHVMDTICWWCGGKPELKEFTDDSRGGPESVARVRAEMDGAEIHVVLNRLCELSNTFSVEGEKAAVTGRINSWKQVEVHPVGGCARTVSTPSRMKTYPAFVAPVLENFIRVVQGDEQPLVSGRDVLASVELIHECYEHRKPVVCAWEKGFDLSRAAPRVEVVKEDRRVLVTGATGFIGGRVVELLHGQGSGGWSVKAGMRQWASAARLGRTRVSIAVMDLLDREQVNRALAGVTDVVHCAKGTPEATVEGTRNLLDAALAQGVRHVVHLSTAEVYGEAGGIVDETRPVRYTGNEYNRMKIDAEKVCGLYQEKGLPITIFRPSIVYGPFSPAWSLRFAALFLAGEWGAYEGYGEGTCNLVYVDDLVKTLLLSLGFSEAFGKAFNVNGPEVLSWNRYFALLNRGLGLPPLRVVGRGRVEASTLALGPVRSLGGFVKKHFLKPVKKAAETFDFLDAAMRKAEHAVKTTPSQDELRLFSRQVIYDDALARSTLPFCPETNVEEGIEHTLEWLRYLGLMGENHDGNTDHRG